MPAHRRVNHFITVSRAGHLMARRVGKAPVCVADAAAGLVLTVPRAEATGAAAPLPERLRVHFRPGGANRELCVTAIVVGDQSLAVADFQDRYGVADEALGRWIRAVVEEALDRAETA